MGVYIENVVVGKPIVEPAEIFARDLEDWQKIEKEKTMWTEERNLAVILKELGIVSRYLRFVEISRNFVLSWKSQILWKLSGVNVSCLFLQVSDMNIQEQEMVMVEFIEDAVAKVLND